MEFTEEILLSYICIYLGLEWILSLLRIVDSRLEINVIALRSPRQNLFNMVSRKEEEKFEKFVISDSNLESKIYHFFSSH
jgi:hypothetical protein